jgi:O-antigen/teichoic acid export membrane protein
MQQQQQPLTLRRNFSWTFVGNLVYAGSQWGMLVVLAKLGSPEMVGQFTLGLAVTAPVVMFTNLQLRGIQATDARNQYIFSDYLGLRLIMIGLALLLIAGIAFTAGYRWETKLVILLMGLAKAFESISDVFYGLLQQYEQMDRIAMSLMIKGPLSLIALGSGVYLTGSVLWGVVGLAVAWALILVGYDARNGTLTLKAIFQSRSIAFDYKDWQDVLRPHWKIKTLIKLAWFALPLGLVMMLISLNTNIPRYFVERYLGERELGIFAAMTYFQVVGTMVVSALGQAASPRLAQYYADGKDQAFRKLLLKLVGIAALLGGTAVLLVLIAGRQILTLVYGSEYANYSDLFAWLMVAAGLGYIASILGYAATAMRRIRYQPVALCAATFVSFCTCYYFISANGLWGATISVVAASATIVFFYSLFLLDL